MSAPPESVLRQATAFLLRLPGLWWGLPWWSGYGLALVIPLTTLAYLVTGPWGLSESLLFTIPLWCLLALDYFGPDEARHVSIETRRGLFDGLLYLLAGLHFVNLLVMGARIAQFSLDTPQDIAIAGVQLVVIRVLMGTASCTSAIAPAHELIHRASKWDRWLGRWLLITVFHDPFFYAHRIGHHAELGHPGDPSTPRRGERYGTFCWRSIRAQWQIARQQVPRGFYQGLAIKGVLAGIYGVYFGPLALFAWLYVSMVGVRLLEAVNYFQHYGLGSVNGSGWAQRAWHCRSGVSLMLFLGLTRHEAHHLEPKIPYQALKSVDGAAVLPHGYLAMAFWVKNASRGFMAWADTQLDRRVLEPGNPVQNEVGGESPGALA